LRERLEDIPYLVRHLFQGAVKEGLQKKSIDVEALDALMAHDWPGNVRELENLTRRLAALYSDETITADIVRSELAIQKPPGSRDKEETRENLSLAVQRHLERYFDGHSGSLPPQGLYDRVLKEVERPLIELCLKATRGNQIKASELLGVNRNTLRKKIRELDIDVVRGVN